MTTVTPKTFTGTDGLGSYADLYKNSEAFNFFDPLNFWDDDKAIDKKDIPKYALLPADNFDTWVDTLRNSISFNTSDNFNTWVDALGNSISFSMPIDDSNLWADTLGVTEEALVASTPITAALSDSNVSLNLVASG